jgi:ABC-2 type transport system permease protein
MQALARTFAIALKEVQQMLRDRLTFAMAAGVPIMQLILFGYAINTDPKGLPTAVVSQDTSPMARSLVAALQTSGYFRVVETGIGEARGDDLLQRGDIQFLVVVPADFGASIVRGERPAVLVAADATLPPAATRWPRWASSHRPR